MKTNKSDTKMKWELQRTWDLNLRLQSWHKRAKQWDKPKAGSKIKAQLNEYNKGKKILMKKEIKGYLIFMLYSIAFVYLISKII